ncbi:polyprenyl synthetase family protein [Actinopolymorpha singaporensis]|uniref:Polyprenyl synthetase n=1 Tax=Actinopolymorpha singaporensis TaxID=117157 RepID=A0A1H1UPU5_9ACTN|nr:polyprenyl synthetase family protein [Actinopolymorpha singaporensis]SDS74300.1 Polyprenyl synthetase [Actinopolymorpha singaporensis]
MDWTWASAAHAKYVPVLRTISERLSAEVEKCPQEGALREFVRRGKGLRPLMVVLAANAVGGDDAAAVAPAVSVELLHAASLIHDDIIDRSPFRRGLPAVHVTAGAATALVVGDWLLVRAFGVLAGPDGISGAAPAPTGTRSRQVRLLADFAAACCTGQLRESGARTANRSLDHRSYYQETAAKTGAPFAAAAALGAVAGGAEDHVVDVLTRFGYALGVAYQAADDLVDGLPEGQLLTPRGLRSVGEHHLALARDALEELSGLIEVGELAGFAAHVAHTFIRSANKEVLMIEPTLEEEIRGLLELARGRNLQYPIAEKQQFVDAMTASGGEVVFRGESFDTEFAARLIPDFFFPLDSEADLLEKTKDLLVARGMRPLADLDVAVSDSVYPASGDRRAEG